MESSRQILENKQSESSLECVLTTSGAAEASLLPHLNFCDLVKLARTNKAMHGLFAISTYRVVLKDAFLTHLADIIVNKPTHKNKEILKKILQLSPDLLTQKIPKVVFEETGQTYIDYTLFQLAFAEYDGWLCRDLFVPCFERALGSVEAASEEMHKQIEEKFPEETVEENAKREEEERDRLMAILEPVKLAITNEQFSNKIPGTNVKLVLNPNTLTHINTFRQAFEVLQPKEIHTGRRFSLNTAEIIYADFMRITRRRPNDSDRYALYSDGLVSCMQRYKPQHLAMSCAQGLRYFQECQAISARNSTLRRIPSTIRDGRAAEPVTHFYDYLRQPSSVFSALVGSSVNIIFGEPDAQVTAIRGGGSPNILFYLRNYINEGTKILQSLCGQMDRSLAQRINF